MSKIAEKKAKDIAKKLEASQAYKFDNFSVVCGAIEGYEQAIQDFLEKAEKWLEIHMPFGEVSYESVYDCIQEFKNYMKDEM